MPPFTPQNQDGDWEYSPPPKQAGAPDDEWEYGPPKAFARGQIVSPIPPPANRGSAMPPPPPGITRPLNPIEEGSLRLMNKAGEVAPALVTPLPVSMARDIYESGKSAVGAIRQGKMPPSPPVAESLGRVVGLNPEAIAESTAASGSVWNPTNVAELLGTSLMWLAGGRLIEPAGAGKVRAALKPEMAVNKLTSALTETRAQARGIPDALKTAMPELVKTAETLQGQPATLESLRGIVDQTQRRLDTTYKGYLNEPLPGGQGMIGDTVVPGHDVATAIRGLATKAMEKVDPEQYQALQNEAVHYEQPFTLRELNEIRMTKNADLNSYYNKDTLAQGVDLKRSQVARKADVAAVNAIRDVLYDTLENRSPAARQRNIRALKDQEGALLAIRDQLDSRIEDLTGAVAREKGMPWWRRASRGTAYSNPLNPARTGIHIGGLLDMVIPQAVREQAAAGHAVEGALGRGVPAPPLAPRLAAGAAVTTGTAKLSPESREVQRLGIDATIPPEGRDIVRTFINAPRYRDWDDDQRREELTKLLARVGKGKGRRPPPPPATQ